MKSVVLKWSFELTLYKCWKEGIEKKSRGKVSTSGAQFFQEKTLSRTASFGLLTANLRSVPQSCGNRSTYYKVLRTVNWNINFCCNPDFLCNPILLEKWL